MIHYSPVIIYLRIAIPHSLFSLLHPFRIHQQKVKWSHYSKGIGSRHIVLQKKINHVGLRGEEAPEEAGPVPKKPREQNVPEFFWLLLVFEHRGLCG